MTSDSPPRVLPEGEGRSTPSNAYAYLAGESSTVASPGNYRSSPLLRPFPSGRGQGRGASDADSPLIVDSSPLPGQGERPVGVGPPGESEAQVRRIVVKVGTSTLSQDGGPPDPEFIDDLARQIAAQRALGRSVNLVTSGSIRAGMDRLNLPGKPTTIPQKQAAAAIGQGLLMHLYSQAFASHNIPVAQVLLTREDLRDRARYLNARNTFAAILGYDAVPIVNENDTVAVDEIRFGDNDTLAALVASLVEADTLILLSDVAGLYDSDPTRNPDAKLIPIVAAADRSIEQLATGSRTTMGTGGMVTKIRAARIASASGIRMHIADGRRPDAIADSLSCKAGTLFLPRTTRLRQRKQWIAYAASPKGSITVNDGAKLRLVQEGKSLLPAGVVEVAGDFQAGDLVQILDLDGLRFAQGFVNYGVGDLEKIKGKRTTEIAALLLTVTVPAGGPTNKKSRQRDEVVHRDDLVLDE